MMIHPISIQLDHVLKHDSHVFTWKLEPTGSFPVADSGNLLLSCSIFKDPSVSTCPPAFLWLHSQQQCCFLLKHCSCVFICLSAGPACMIKHRAQRLSLLERAQKLMQRKVTAVREVDDDHVCDAHNVRRVGGASLQFPSLSS